MLIYFKDQHGTLRCLSGDIDLDDQNQAKAEIRGATGITPATAVFGLVVDNPPLESA